VKLQITATRAERMVRARNLPVRDDILDDDGWAVFHSSGCVPDR